MIIIFAVARVNDSTISVWGFRPFRKFLFRRRRRWRRVNGIFRAIRVLTPNDAYTKFNWISGELAIPSNRAITAANANCVCAVCRSNYVLCMPISSVNTRKTNFSLDRHGREQDFSLKRNINWSISYPRRLFISFKFISMMNVRCALMSSHSIGYVHTKNEGEIIIIMWCVHERVRKNRH